MGRKADVVVITGASAGVGRATAVAFAKRGAKIGLIARGRDRLRDAAREVEANGGEALILPMDVADPVAMERAAKAVEDAFGPIDVWVNNAMVSVFSPVHRMRPREYRRVTEVTYLGTVYGTLAALRCMRQHEDGGAGGAGGRGVIVQVGSALSYRSIPLQSAYCAAKHAMVGFTNSLRSELIDEGSNIKITAVHLPAMNTPQFSWVKSRLSGRAQPVEPIFQPEVAADAIVWASRHPRREYLVGWPTTKAVWGHKFMPGFLDQYLADQAIEGQQADEPEDPGRPQNLWRPVPGPYGAHGEFDHRSHRWSAQWFISKHRKALAGLALLAIGGVLAATLGNGRTAKRALPAAQA